MCAEQSRLDQSRTDREPVVVVARRCLQVDEEQRRGRHGQRAQRQELTLRDRKYCDLRYVAPGNNTGAFATTPAKSFHSPLCSAITVWADIYNLIYLHLARHCGALKARDGTTHQVRAQPHKEQRLRMHKYTCGRPAPWAVSTVCFVSCSVTAAGGALLQSRMTL